MHPELERDFNDLLHRFVGVKDDLWRARLQQEAARIVRKHQEAGLVSEDPWDIVIHEIGPGRFHLEFRQPVIQIDKETTGSPPTMQTTCWISIPRKTWDQDREALERAAYDCFEGYGIELLRAKRTGARDLLGRRKFVQVKARCPGRPAADIRSIFYSRVRSPVMGYRLALPALD